jgi:hypothetical protein
MKGLFFQKYGRQFKNIFGGAKKVLRRRSP